MYIVNTAVSNIIDAVKKINVQKNESLLLLFGEASELDYENLIEELNKLSISFFGGVFPGIIFGENNYTHGCILKKLPVIHHPVIVKGLDNENFEIPDLNTWAHQDDVMKRTVLTFVDGLTSNIATYLSELYHELGDTVKFLGGGSGSLTLEQKPCIITTEGIFQDVAVLCLLDLGATLSVKHGWSKLVGPFVATRTDKNIIQELNWENAFEVYKKVVDQDTGTSIENDNFFEIAKGYPFGIFKENGEDIVRDPIAGNEKGELVCVGEVPENTVLYILKGESNALINSAEAAIRECVTTTDEKIDHTLIVDCISRRLFLENEFSKELKAINSLSDPNNEEAIPQGVLSLGEISSSGDGLLEFYNKTLVVGALYNEVSRIS